MDKPIKILQFCKKINILFSVACLNKKSPEHRIKTALFSLKHIGSFLRFLREAAWWIQKIFQTFFKKYIKYFEIHFIHIYSSSLF